MEAAKRASLPRRVIAPQCGQVALSPLGCLFCVESPPSELLDLSTAMFDLHLPNEVEIMAFLWQLQLREAREHVCGWRSGAC